MYDLAVIGGGPGGYVAAEKAGAKGLSVVLFEKNELGGVCLNEGCIPTKTLLYSAKVYDCARHGEKYGVNVTDPAIDFVEVMARKKKVVKKLVGGVKLKMKNAGVEVVRGEVEITGRQDGVISLSCDGNRFEAKNLLVCTGSEASVPPIPGLDLSDGIVLTNREILSLESRPESLVIIGGGVIGMEFASFFNSIGTSVTVIEMLPKILGPLDEEISLMVQDVYAKRGVDFKLNCKVTSIDGNSVNFMDADGNACSVSGEKILLSVGRRANIKGFGLENLGVETDRGIKVDGRMRTNVPGVYAAGDVTGFSQLAHTASREAEVAVNDICGISDVMTYDAIPSVVYTNPEVACVGLTESEANAKGLSVKVAKLPMAYSGRFVAENDGFFGLCKLVVNDADGKVLGVQMVGNPCSEIIQGICVAIQAGMDVESLKRTVFPHPTVSEIIKETISAL